MNFRYSDWSSSAATSAPGAPVRAGNIGAVIGTQGRRHEKRHRWPSMALSISVHVAIAYACFHVAQGALKPPPQLDSIKVTITQSQPEPALPEPPAPKLEKLPQMLQDTPPPVKTESPMQIAVSLAPAESAPPSSSTPPADAKPSEAPVSPPRFDAAYLNNPAPVYPNMSRRLREVGTVLLRVRVSPEGRPMEIQLETSSSYKRLDDAALDAVRKWLFEPAKRGEKSVEAWVIVPVEFSLSHR